MNEKIRQMAQEAGIHWHPDHGMCKPVESWHIEEFARLVAEDAAKVLDTLATDWIEFNADGEVVPRADRCVSHAARTIRARYK
jgi:hypothetical protein